MWVRKHLGSYKDSMKTAQEIEPTMEDLSRYFGVPKEKLSVEGYGVDVRGWGQTYIVVVDDRALGFCDAMIE